MSLQRPSDGSSVNSSHFISASELRSNLTQVVLVDCDLPAAYHRLHIPGAHLAPCRYWKADGSDEGLLGMEDPQRFGTLIGPWGLSNDSRLVAYDSSGGLNAARLCWTLERFGFFNACVLDGGLNSWLAGGYPLTQEPATESTSQLHLAGPTNLNRLTLQDMAHKLQSDAVLWDDRSDEEWARGRMPGSVHLEWSRLLDHRGLLLSEGDVRELLVNLGLLPDREICVYCQGGIRAAHSYWVLKHLGYERVAVFDGSWAEYSQSELPVVKDPE